MFLQLAEGENNGNYSALAQDSALDVYVFIPNGFLPEFDKDTFVRADYFNKYDTTTASALLDALSKYQTQSLNEGAVESALNFVPGVGPFASKGVALAKQLVAKRQAKVQAGTAKPLIKPGSKLSGLLDKLKGSQQQKKFNLPEEPVGASVTLPSGTVNVGFNPAEQTATTGTFWAKYKTPILIGGGLLAAAAVYMIVKKKK